MQCRAVSQETAFLSDNDIFLIHSASVNAPANKSLADLVEGLLPQTQCTKCGYPSCRLYAEAIANGEANINQCPPGGAEGIARISGLLGRPVTPLNPDNGIERPRPVAVIDENLCIGCTLCIQACPVDAILGGPKLMHTIISNLCTGCDLCVAPCPVDCISMVPITGEQTGWAAWSQEQADAARVRHDMRTARLQREQAEHEVKLADRAAKLREAPTAEAKAEQDRKKAIIQAAMERVKQKKAST